MRNLAVRQADGPVRLMFMAMLCAVLIAAPSAAQSGSDTTLQLPQALHAAVQSSPRFAAAREELAGSEADAMQASLWDNPDLSVDVENFGSDRRGTDQVETTVGISQRVRLGGDLFYARRAADAEVHAARIRAQIVLTDVLATTASEYVLAVAASERVSLQAEVVSLTDQMADAVNRRVEAGRASPIEQQRVEVVTARVRSELVSLQLQQISNLRRLFMMLGEEFSNSTRLEAADALSGIGDLEVLDSDAVDSSLELLLTAAQTDIRRADVGRARADAIPDATVGLGVRRLAGGQDTALVASISLPIPVINRNQGAIAAAGRRETAARLTEGSVRRQLLGDFASSYTEWAAARNELDAIRTRILPAAERSFESARMAYHEGQIDLLNFLDVQRQFFELRAGAIDAAARVHLATIQIDLLTGGTRLRALADAHQLEASR
ncbi:TolC family protein [uncultured Maricaulis sp.]|uniref:TolC family protein n=1 Tax=uncultured Maricaulis sp. TaxID=174710 RepID=UPI0030DB19FB|tara:strand:+ start:17169 stop:18482 length:1314 start_codon:yes stop_codon:yes gene_type:complete